jgi:hypothetical protein
VKSEESMAGEDSKLKETSIGGNTFYDWKNKIWMKIPEFKRSGIGLIAEFHGIPNVFPNQDMSSSQNSRRGHRHDILY